MFADVLKSVCGVGLICLACTALPETAPHHPAAIASPRELPRAQVILHTQPPQTVQVEVAQTAAAHNRGLMFRDALAADAGMLFIFEHGSVDKHHTFWMRNTYLPLDMLFIAKNGQVVHVIERAEPLSLVARASLQPCAFVLEVNGGFAAAHHVTVGTNVSFVDLQL